MSLLSPKALARIRALVVETMGDTCQRLERTAVGVDSHGRPQYSYQPVGEVLVCGLKPSRGPGLPSSDDGVGGVVLADYIIRLPYGTELHNHDRLRILGRHGESLAQPFDADIVGAVEHGLTAVSVKLKVVFYG